MTMNLAFASVSPRSVPCTRLVDASRCRPSAAATPVMPHVDQARSLMAGASTRIDDALFALAVAVLLVAVALPWPSAVSLLA
jgi:hypothetical protein